MTGHLNKKTGGKRIGKAGVLLLALAALLLVSCQGTAGDTASGGTAGQASVSEAELALGEIPEYDGEPYVEVEDGEPDFEEDELTGDAYESYSELDGLGRCQEAKACVGLETMPDEERGNISEVKPTGWQSVEYDQVDGGHLYNRCHLIGFQLTGENANERNLITGTRYMNTEGMLPFENEVADYVKETGNHVLYQVTPVFEGDNLVASGVWMEAESVEDGGRGVSFNVYVFNIQPGIEIDYSQGNSWEIEGGETCAEWVDDGEEHTYILNTNTKKFHDPDCSGAADIKPDNKETYTGSRQALLEDGYEPCGSCDP